ncbi:MAG: asparaginase [Pseudonocardiales bacterium]|nr:MAG: asparaginase [Pseudonocardiales bacterium]
MPPDAFVLLDVTRNGFVESHHRGSLVLLDASGEVAVSAGAPERSIMPRSSLKPLQAITMVECGFPGRDGSLALAASSHDGADIHLAVARSILAAAGLDESALQCPPDLPYGREAMLAHVRAGGAAQRICHNCSGKHAAMLATCVANGWDIDSYRAVEHPLQVAIRAGIEASSGEAVEASGVDGCGAPAHAITLVGLARAFAAVARATDATPAALVRDAMRAHPDLIGGAGRVVTELTARVDGLLCKDGAEGVWGAALPDGRAFAAKVDDGGVRALGPVLAAALRYWGLDNDVVRRWSTVEVLGAAVPVGAIGWSPALVDLLTL